MAFSQAQTLLETPRADRLFTNDTLGAQLILRVEEVAWSDS